MEIFRGKKRSSRLFRMRYILIWVERGLPDDPFKGFLFKWFSGLLRSGPSICVRMRVCIHTQTHTYSLTHVRLHLAHMHIYCLRSRDKPALGGPAAGMHPSSLLKGQLVCHNNIALPSCHFMREELKQRCSWLARIGMSQEWVMGPGVTLFFRPAAFRCLPALLCPWGGWLSCFYIPFPQA